MPYAGRKTIRQDVMPDIKNLSKSDLVAILGIIEYARSCRTTGGFRELLMRTKDLFEAEYAICGSAGVEGLRVKGLASVVNGNLPEAWLSHYAIEEFCSADPILNYHARYSRPGLWSEAMKVVDTPESRKVYNHATDFGLIYGLATGVYVPERQEICVCSFSGGRNVFKDRHKNLLDILVLHINNAYSRVLFAKESLSGEGSDDPMDLSVRLL